jgi:hypothetical protein
MTSSLTEIGMRSLDFEEATVLRRSRHLNYEPPWAFRAPAGCRSLEEWAADGERRWALIRTKLAQARATAACSPMLANHRH